MLSVVFIFSFVYCLFWFFLANELHLKYDHEENIVYLNLEKEQFNLEILFYGRWQTLLRCISTTH